MQKKKKGQRKKSTKSQKVVSIKSHRRSQQAKKEKLQESGKENVQIPRELIDVADLWGRALKEIGFEKVRMVDFFEDFGAFDVAPVVAKAAKEYPKVGTTRLSREGVIVEEFLSGKIELDLGELLMMWLPIAYSHHRPQHGAYEKEKVMEKATQTVLDTTRKLLGEVSLLESKLLLEPLFLIISGAKARQPLDRLFKTRLKSGRKPADRGAVIQEAKRLYDELMKILTPGFDKANKSVKKYKAICDAVDAAGIPDDGRYIADPLWERRSARQVAIYLTALTLERHESTVKRYLPAK